MVATMNDKGDGNKNEGNQRNIRVCQTDTENPNEKKLKGKFHVN